MKAFIYTAALSMACMMGSMTAQEIMQVPNEATTASLTRSTPQLQMPKTLQMSSEGRYIYQKYQVFNNLSKEELYKRSTQWLKNKVNTGATTPVLDEANHMGFTATAVITLTGIPDSEVQMQFRVSLKEGKARIDGYSFVFHSRYKGNAYDNEFEQLEAQKLSVSKEKVYEAFDKAFTAWIAEYEKAMN